MNEKASKLVSHYAAAATAATMTNNNNTTATMSTCTTAAPTINAAAAATSTGKNDTNAKKKVSVAEIQDIVRKGFKSGDYGNDLLRDVVVRSYGDGRKSISRPDNAQEYSGASSSSLSSSFPHLLVSFVVTPNLCNAFRTLHGGAQATAVDIFTSALLYLHQPVSSVTADLHVSYLASAPVGSTILCHCTIARAGAGLQFTTCDLYRELPPLPLLPRERVLPSSSASAATHPPPPRQPRRILVAKGLHTKYVLKHGRTSGFEGEKNTTTSNNNTKKTTTPTTVYRSKL